MNPQDKERLKRMYNFAQDATTIAIGIYLERLTSDKAYQYSLLYPLGQIEKVFVQEERVVECEETETFS